MRATRRKELTTFTYDTSRCMFCGLCEDACPVDALELTQDFELASYAREGQIWDRADARRGAQAHSIQMLIDTILFYIFALLVLGGGFFTITRRNAVHSAISLIVSLLGVAGLYLLQQAEFLFAVQVVLYVGGIMLLFLFVIMLVNLDQAAQRAAVQQAVAGGPGGGGGRGRRDRLRSVPRQRRVPRRRQPGGGAAASRPWATPRCWPMRCFPNTCCRSRSPRILLLVAVVGSVVMAKKRI